MGQTNRRPVNLKASVFLAELRRRKIQLELESNLMVKFIYSEKATKFCEIFTLLLSYVVPVKSKVKPL